MVSDRVSDKNGKHWRYIVGYQSDGEITMPELIKAPENIIYLSTIYASIIITQLPQRCSVILRFPKDFFTIEPSWIKLNQLFEKLTANPIKQEGTKLNTEYREKMHLILTLKKYHMACIAIV